MTTKTELHQLVETLPDGDAARLLAGLRDPVGRSLLLAPLGEPEPDERAALAAADAEEAAGGARVSQEELERELGL